MTHSETGTTLPNASEKRIYIDTGGAETPSGKGAKDENFPVGSFLLPEHLRKHVKRYYDFARAIDDVADNPSLSAEEKIARLNAFEDAVKGEGEHGAAYDKAHALRRTLLKMNIPARHAADLTDAFRDDAVKSRQADWSELVYYCERSANPVGRFLIDLHGESRDIYPYSDGLCTALQVLNHLQDAQEDFLTLGRVYVPEDWMREEGATVEELGGSTLSPAMRRVFDRMLAGTDEQIALAKSLPGGVRDKRFAMECAVIVRLAEKLSKKLKKGDPLATRVKLTKFDFATCGLSGMVWGQFGGKRGQVGEKPAKSSVNSAQNGTVIPKGAERTGERRAEDE